MRATTSTRSPAQLATRAATRAGLLLVPWILVLASTRCGSADEEEADKPDGASSGIPADWDGVNDYAASALKAVTE